MFEFLTKDTSVFIEPIYRNGNSLVFVADTLLEWEKPILVHDRVGMKGEVQVHQRRRTEARDWIYFALLTEGDFQPDSVLVGHKLRSSERHKIGIRVRAPQLPGYSALTEDVSLEGAQLLTSGPLRVGEEMALHMDLDEGYPEVKVIARVCWSRITQPIRVGVTFVDFQENSEQTLRNFLAARTGQALPGGIEEDDSAAADHGTLLEREAYLKEAFEDELGVILKLVTHDEFLELRFSKPRVLECSLATRLVARIATEKMSDGQVRTTLVDSAGETLVELESALPEVFCRSLRTEDLD